MKSLGVYGIKDDLSSPRIAKNAVKAIIMSEGKVGMMHLTKNELYDFPGGTVEEGETHVEALLREVKEEAGLIVKPSSIKEFGEYTLVYKNGNKTYEKLCRCYLCDVEDNCTEPHLTEGEKAFGLQFTFVDIDEAVSKNLVGAHGGYKWAEGPMQMMKFVKDNFC